MTAWLLAHYTDVLLHLALDLTGGITLKCILGMCKHPHHQAAAWVTLSVLISVSTVVLIG